MDEWDQKVQWMRKVGATEAEWNDRALIHCKLGPEVTVEPSLTETQIKDAEEQREIAEQRRIEEITFGAA